MHLDAEALGAFLATLPGEPLQHLLTCARCRQRLSAMVFDLRLPTEGADAEPAVLPAVNTVLLRAIELAQSADRSAEAPETRQTIRELLGIPADYRLHAIAAQGHFRTAGVAQAVLIEARRSSVSDPARSHHLAGLALGIVERLPDTTSARRIEAEAVCLLGEAARRFGRFDVGEDLFKQAAHGLRHEPLMLEARVTLCRSWAALRQDQGRTDEALGLLERAASIAEELGNFEELAATQLAYGWLLLDELDTERALIPLREALSLLDVEKEPYQVFSALHALALAYGDLQDDAHLADVFSALEELAPQLPDRFDPVRVRWIKARAEWRREEYDKAISILEQVFEDLLDKEVPGFEAALAGLELARMVAEKFPADPSLPETLKYIASTLRALPPERLAPHLLPVVRFALKFPTRRQGSYLDALLSAITYVERARFNPQFPYHPTPEPELILVWNDLSRGQRRDAARAAGVELDRAGYPRSSEDQSLIAWTHEALTGVRIELPANLDEEDETRPE